MKIEYPKFLYASGGRAKVVKTPEEHFACGEEWYESPAFIPTAESAAPPASEYRVPEQVTVIAESADAKLKKFYAAPAKVVIDNVVSLDDEDDLRELRDIEENRPGGARRTVLRAVADRLAMLTAAPTQTM